MIYLFALKGVNFLEFTFEEVGEMKFVAIGPGSILGPLLQHSFQRVIVQVLPSPFRVQARLLSTQLVIVNSSIDNLL